ncbi:hypothetical protein Tco_0410716 [Tanacetum coccineum]
MGYAPPCYVDTYKRKNIEAIENVVENESHFSLEVVDDGLSLLAMLTKHFIWRTLWFGNSEVGSSMSGVGEGKVNSMGGMGEVVWSMWEGVDLGVSKRLLLEVAGEMIDESGGIEVGEVGGGADT